MPTMTYAEFITLVDQTYNNFNWRYGQSIMNVLHGAWSAKYNELVGSDKDCYYDDHLVSETLKNLQTHWNNS